MAISNATSLSVNCHVPVVIHLFSSIPLDNSDDFTRLHRHWCSFDYMCAVSIWGKFQNLEGTQHYRLPLEPSALHSLSFLERHTLHTPSRHMENHDPTPCAKPLSVHVSHGCSYINRRWNHRTVRPVRFWRASIPFHALGALVDRRRSFLSMLLGPHPCHVSVFVLHSNSLLISTLLSGSQNMNILTRG